MPTELGHKHSKVNLMQTKTTPLSPNDAFVSSNSPMTLSPFDFVDAPVFCLIYKFLFSSLIAIFTFVVLTGLIVQLLDKCDCVSLREEEGNYYYYFFLIYKFFHFCCIHWINRVFA